MRLKKLQINMMEYGPNNGKYVGAIQFYDETGEISLNLTPEHIERIFELCADGIVEVAKRAASDMTCAIIEQKKAISSATNV